MITNFSSLSLPEKIDDEDIENFRTNGKLKESLNDIQKEKTTDNTYASSLLK